LVVSPGQAASKPDLYRRGTGQGYDRGRRQETDPGPLSSSFTQWSLPRLGRRRRQGFQADAAWTTAERRNPQGAGGVHSPFGQVPVRPAGARGSEMGKYDLYRPGEATPRGAQGAEIGGLQAANGDDGRRQALWRRGWPLWRRKERTA